MFLVLIFPETSAYNGEKQSILNSKMARTAGYYHSGVSLHLDTWSAIDRVAIPQGITRHGFIVAAIKKALSEASNSPSSVDKGELQA